MPRFAGPENWVKPRAVPNLRPLNLILVVVAIVAVALPLIVTHLVPAAKVEVGASASPVLRTTAPRVAPPPVEPVEYAEIAPDDARSINAKVPFVKGPVPPARPYHFVGGKDDLARATDCLAAAAYYEAGDDAPGEQAVAQVVLNRLRHPAFPKTVCGVVFQGAERSTGCQFTFTCDGALARTPSAAAWKRAREIASKALRGGVYKPVGWATHYHTDWVVPYWSASLDKIAELHTHLFFRWTGWWGTGPAFNRGQQPEEAPVTKLAMISDAHRMSAAVAGNDAAIVAASTFQGRAAAPLGSDAGTFLAALNPVQADEFADLALAACDKRAKCKFMGWTKPDGMPTGMPLTPEQIAAMSFSYIRDSANGLERMLWNCEEFTKRHPCMRRLMLRATPAPRVGDPPKGPPPLDGVRRKEAAETALSNIAG
ncbi:cell wall hydrolase [Sphingomonas jeddahensis]|nr:cell wall hydrolase [Sphingomonas jeddahensis]